MATKVWFDNVNKRDGRALVKWWNWGGPSTWDFSLRAHPSLKGRYQVVYVDTFAAYH